jgi:hypothetical protein
MEGDVIWSLKWTSNISESRDQNIHRVFGQFYEDIYNDFTMCTSMESFTKANTMFSKVQRIWH